MLVPALAVLSVPESALTMLPAFDASSLSKLTYSLASVSSGNTTSETLISPSEVCSFADVMAAFVYRLMTSESRSAKPKISRAIHPPMPRTVISIRLL